MEELKDIYERIELLRDKGMKMKEIAQRVGYSPSVLSALYTTVFPAYFKNIAKGMAEGEALDNALVWANNVSKKKLLSSMAGMRNVLLSIDVPGDSLPSDGVCPLISEMECSSRRAAGRISCCGMYMSYSASSASNAMKAEPYLIAPAVSGSYLEVGHNSVYGATHWGMAMMSGMNHLYMTFNELKEPDMALFQICLKIPMYDCPPFLRGVYTGIDYSYNPIARRILLVRMSDSVARDEFAGLKGSLRHYDELEDRERLYYDYTCRPEDTVRICDIPAPTMTEDDLAAEKKILSLREGL